MIDNNCVYPSLHNNSYVESVSNSNVQADNGLYYSYTDVFNEYTTQTAGVACSKYANCYIGCSCKTDWNKRSASASSVSDVSNLQTSGVKTASASGLSGNVSTMAAGDGCTINITDPRYGTKCSISSTKDCAGVCDGSAYFRCTSGSTNSSCPSGQYSSYLGKQKCSSGDATNSTSCYTCYNCSYSCPSGYYTSAESGYYLTSTYKYQVCNGDSSQTNSTKCYTKAACSYSCPSGYYTSADSGYYLTNTYKYQVCNGDSSQTNSTKCYERKACSYSCPSGYYTSAGSGYYLTSTYKYQVCDGDSSQTNSTKCYTRKANTCDSAGYVSSCPSGQTGEEVSVPSGTSSITCYNNCKDANPCSGVQCGPGQHCMMAGELKGQCCFHDVWGDVTISSNDTNLAAVTCIRSGYDGYEWIKMNCPNETTIEYAVKCKRFN